MFPRFCRPLDTTNDGDDDARDSDVGDKDDKEEDDDDNLVDSEVLPCEEARA